MNEQFANAFADVQNLETLANISAQAAALPNDEVQDVLDAQAASLPNDEVQDVLDSCILESTKIKHVNQAILYFKFAFDCFCSENKKHLNEDFFHPSIIDELREAVRKDSKIINPKRRERRPYFRQLLK